MNSFYFRFFAFVFLCSMAWGKAVGQCTSDAGTMVVNLLEECGQGPITAIHNGDEVLDANDVLQFALHTSSGGGLGTVLALNTGPTFGFDLGSMAYGTTYYISAIAGDDDGSGNVVLTDPCLSVAAGTPVVWHGDLPTAALSGGGTICGGSGETVFLTISLTGSAPWLVGYSINGINQAPLSINSNPYSLPIGESSAGVISLTAVTDANGCTGIVSGSAVVNVVEAPIVSNVSVQCGPTNTDFTVTITINGGDPASYAVSPPSGTLSGNVFTSDPIPAGNGYSFTVTDANDCDPVVVSQGTVLCNCTTQAGEMDPTPIMINDCNSGPAIGLYDDTNQVLDGNDILVFILHTDAGSNLGTILSQNAVPEFTFNAATMTNGTTYYISAVVGDGNGTGGVSFNDPCLDVSPGTPVVFTATPLFVTVGNIITCPGGPIVVALTVAGGTLPYTYLWTGPNGWTSTEPTPTLPQVAGTYTVSITDIFGCTASATFTVEIPDPVVCDIQPDGELSCANPEVSIILSCTGGTPPYTYTWQGNPNLIITQPGTYNFTITDASGCVYVDTVTVLENQEECGLIRGTVAEDGDGACLFDAADQPLANWMVRASNGSEEFFGLTDADGGYEIFLLPGTYSVDVILPPNSYWASCQPSISATLADAADVDTADFAIESLVDCPFLEVDISTPFLRRCFPNNYTVSYCNLGTVAATDAYIELTLDTLISVTGASIPFFGPSNGVYTFEIGDVLVGECGSFTVHAHTSCNSVLGQTLCAEAHIYPDTICTPSPNWSGASIQLTSECTADSIIFTIRNVGAGDMAEPAGFIVVEDGVMLMTAPENFQLQAGEAFSLSYPANGSTWALLAEQVEGHPGYSAPMLAVEGCGTNGQGTFSTGFASQFAENDADPFLSIDCQPVIGSYDPNDKNGYPKGYGDDHLIEPGQELDYHIRFQNTGTDTAFKVVIQDVIAPELDIATLRPGTSSHPYQLDIHNDTLLFIFENILLPDSNVNEPGSHGFVKFRIGQKAGLPLGTIIENEAAIYFDFNDPVITNTTAHQLGERFVTTTTQEAYPPAIDWAVFPNPFSNETAFFIKGADFQEVEIEMYDLTGRLLQRQKAQGGMARIAKGRLSPGLYFYKITVNGMVAGQGKLAVE